MANTVVMQYSTTRWYDGGDDFFSFMRTLKLRWENKWSWAIRLMCHSPFSHVDFLLPNDSTMKPEWRGMLLGASSMGDGTPCIEGNPNGVAIRPHNYEQFGYRRQMVLRTPYADMIYATALTQLGKPFDNGALKDFLSPKFPGARDWRDTGQWFCAEFSVWAKESAGYYGGPLPWPKNRASPTDDLMCHINDANWINRDVFWEPIPGLKMEPWES